ncbi:hypothetical protein ABK040_010345 [Willaertia magna]
MLKNSLLSSGMKKFKLLPSSSSFTSLLNKGIHINNNNYRIKQHQAMIILLKQLNVKKQIRHFTFRFRGQEKIFHENPIRKYPRFSFICLLLLFGYSFALLTTFFSTEYFLEKLIWDKENNTIDLEKLIMFPHSLLTLLKIKEKYLTEILKAIERDIEGKSQLSLHILYQISLDRSVARSILEETNCLEILFNRLKKTNDKEEVDILISNIKLFSTIKSSHPLIAKNLDSLYNSVKSRLLKSEVLDVNLSYILSQLIINEDIRKELNDEQMGLLLQISYRLSKSNVRRVEKPMRNCSELIIRESKGDKERIKQIEKKVDQYYNNFETAKFVSNNIYLPVLVFAYAMARYAVRIVKLPKDVNKHYYFAKAIKYSSRSVLAVTSYGWLFSSINLFEYKSSIKDYLNDDYKTRLQYRANRQEIEKIAQSFITPILLAILLPKVEFIILPYLLSQMAVASSPWQIMDIIFNPEQGVSKQREYIESNIEKVKEEH